MDLTLEIVNEEIKQLFSYAERVLDYLSRVYSAELVLAKGELAKFREAPFDKPENVTVAVLKQFESETEQVQRQVTILRNCLASRIATFASNYNLSSLAQCNEDLVLKRDYAEIMIQARNMKEGLISHFNNVVNELDKLKTILGEEINTCKALQTPASLSAHLTEARNLNTIFSSEEIPQYDKIISSFALNKNSFEAITNQVKAKANAIIHTARDLGSGAIADVKRQTDIRRKVLLGTFFVVAICIKIAGFHKAVLKATARRGFSRLFTRVSSLEDLSPLGRSLINTLNDSGTTGMETLLT